MGLSGLDALIKLFVGISNLIFLCFGIGIIVLAVWMLIDPRFYISMAQFENNYYIGLYLLLAVGILLVVTTFLGCCGAFRESRCMLIGYFCSLLVVFVAGISAALWGYYNSDDLILLVKHSVKTTVETEYKTVEFRRQLFDHLQAELHCCGAEGPRDWSRSHDGKVDIGVTSDPVKYEIPASCCVSSINRVKCDTDRKIEGPIPETIFKQGCSDKLIELLKEHVFTIMCVGLGLTIVECLALIFACILIYAIKRSDRYKA